MKEQGQYDNDQDGGEGAKRILRSVTKMEDEYEGARRR